VRAFENAEKRLISKDAVRGRKADPLRELLARLRNATARVSLQLR
jgi:hypothetical protein